MTRASADGPPEVARPLYSTGRSFWSADKFRVRTRTSRLERRCSYSAPRVRQSLLGGDFIFFKSQLRQRSTFSWLLKSRHCLKPKGFKLKALRGESEEQDGQSQNIWLVWSMLCNSQGLETELQSLSSNIIQKLNTILSLLLMSLCARLRIYQSSFM